MRSFSGRGWTASLICLSVVVAACATGGGSSGPPLAGCKSGTTLATFWTSHTPPDSDSLKHVIDTYNGQSTVGCVKMVQVPGSETDVTKLMTAVRGGSGPDVYMLDRFTVAERAAAGVLTDLTKYGAGNLSSKYVDFAWKEATFQGKPYALPLDTDVRALWYRKDLLKAAGVDITPLDPANGPVTIDQVRTMANKVNQQDASGAYNVIGFVPWVDQGWHYTWGFDFGGSFFDSGTCKVTPNDPKIVSAFTTMFGDWAKALGPEKAQTWVSSFLPPNNPPQQWPFLTGKTAFIITGDWPLNWVKQYKPDLQYGVTYIPVPKTGDTPSTWAGGWSLVIPTGAKHADAGYDFMKYLAGPDGMKTYVTETQHLPTWKALGSDASLYQGDHVFFATKLLPVAKSRPPIPVGAFYWDQLSTAQDAVVRQSATADKALADVATNTNAKLQQFCPLK